MILNFKRARLGPQLCPGHERTAKSQTKLEAASSTPLTALGISQHRELKTPGGGGGEKNKKKWSDKGETAGVFLLQSTAVSMAWSSRSQVWGHRIRDESRVTLEFKGQSRDER